MREGEPVILDHAGIAASDFAKAHAFCPAYGAFVLDFDGTNIEAVCHLPE